jgi:hypothetical protein
VVHLESYHNSGPRSSETVGGDIPASPPGGGVGPLVNRSISQQTRGRGNPVESLLVYPRAVKLVRCYEGKKPETAPPLRSEIQSFSQSSKRRLKFTASNAFPALISQFGMTYHHATPDGHTVKKHLNAFLTDIRRKFPTVGYLWILEFQERGTPHFHIFLNLEHDQKTGKALAGIWNRIAEPESKEHLKFHQHENNFIPWDMGSGSYLCKYLDKEHQKQVPEGFQGVGRFWGNSRKLVPEPDTVEMRDIADSYNDYTCTHIVRTLCKHHEKSLRQSPWKSSARKRPTSYTLPNGAIIARQLFRNFENHPPEQPPMPAPF